MALESPFKKEIDKANKDIDILNRLYNVYFSGGEEDPPRNQRKTLDMQIEKIKSQLPMAANSSDRFQANSVISRYKVICGKWDKHLKGIELGTIIRPKKRD